MQATDSIIFAAKCITLVSFHFINRPIQATREDYEQAVSWLVNRFQKLPEVLAVFQFGNLNKPGISDIDLLVVFKDNVSCIINPFENYPPEFKRLFTHGIDAISASHFSKNKFLPLWQHYNCHFNRGVEADFSNSFSSETWGLLKQQMALEFLASNYIDFTIQKEYRIIKVRSLLQHVKGLAFDLDYLNLKNEKLSAEISKIKSWIVNWFSSTPADRELIEWFHGFYPLYTTFVHEIFDSRPFYLPKKPNYVYAKNIIIRPSGKISYQRSGLPVPFSGLLNSKKLFNLMHRLNKFEFQFPVSFMPIDDALKNRVDFFLEIQQYNRFHFLNFHTLSSRFIQCL